MRTETRAAAEELDAFFATPANYAHAGNIAALCTRVFAASPDDNFVQSDPTTHPVRVVETSVSMHSAEAYVDITDAGRDALRRCAALVALFGRPWPTVAQARAVGTCPSCRYLLTSPGCSASEHKLS
jgi:hypothetical protein